MLTYVEDISQRKKVMEPDKGLANNLLEDHNFYDCLPASLNNYSIY